MIYILYTYVHSTLTIFDRKCAQEAFDLKKIVSLIIILLQQTTPHKVQTSDRKVKR